MDMQGFGDERHHQAYRTIEMNIKPLFRIVRLEGGMK